MKTQPSPLPSRPIERLARPLAHFLHIEASSGVVLLLCAIVAIIIANTGAADAYRGFWDHKLNVGIGDAQLDYPLWYWVNDALMSVFFFVIGLELKRELVAGELRDRRKVVLPVAAAVGGVLAPVGIFLALQGGEPGEQGWAIPMATDIAFVVGCMALLGRRVPHGLKVFMLSLAIVDDLLAVLVIAIFFTPHLSGAWLAAATGGVVVVVAMNRAGIRSVPFYWTVGVVVWLCTLKSGIHPTIAGVVLGLLTPARQWLDRAVLLDAVEHTRSVVADASPGDARERMALAELAFVSNEAISPLARLERDLHPWVAFVIMPVFALANAGVAVDVDSLGGGLSLAVAAGLVVGKPLGISLASLLVVKLGVARLPTGVTWPVLLGAGCLAGIGFTMALFIATLGLSEEPLRMAKQGVLLGSTASGLLGMGLLALALRASRAEDATGKAVDEDATST